MTNKFLGIKDHIGAIYTRKKIKSGTRKHTKILRGWAEAYVYEEARRISFRNCEQALYTMYYNLFIAQKFLFSYYSET